jgi:hypothetical protein
LAQFITAWFGWRVTKADAPLTPKQRRRYDITFIVAGIIGVALVGIAAYRAGEERAHLQLKPDLSFTFPGVRDLWSRAAEFLPVGSPVRLNVNYKNVGSGPATNTTHAGRIYVEPDDSLASNRDAISKFDAWLKLQSPLTKTTIAKDDTGITTFDGDILTPEDFQNIIHGRRFIYEVGTFWFDDDLGGHYHNFCWILREPREGGTIMFQGCDEHTDEK